MTGRKGPSGTSYGMQEELNILSAFTPINTCQRITVCIENVHSQRPSESMLVCQPDKKSRGQK